MHLERDTALLKFSGKICLRQVAFSMQRHKSPGSFPATLGFIEPTANALPEITSSTWGCYVVLRCALEELQPVKLQLDSQQETKSFF